MASAINNNFTRSDPVKQEPKGKFTAFCDWTRVHKREIAIVLLIVGIAAMFFGAGVIMSMLPLVHFGTAELIPFVANLFHFKGVMIIGLSAKGKLFFAAVGSVIGGAGLAGYGSGVLSGLPKKK